MSQFTRKDMTRGEFISSASFAYSPAYLAKLAVSALLSEVHAAPKPGLVDRNNSGAHTDMDLEMFERSASALKLSFLHCAEAGLAWGTAEQQDLPALASQLRLIGLEAERRMYEATGGVNTHKGAIFSMGILCGAVAMGFETMQALQENCRKIASALLEEGTASSMGEETHGLAARRTCGTGGIRKEALSGFDTAFSTGLPSIEEALAAGCSENASMVYALLRIMASTEDSNLVHRGGVGGMDFAQKEALHLTAGGPKTLDLEEVRRLDGEFIKRNLSPGGSADLLAFSAMLYRIKKGNHND